MFFTVTFFIVTRASIAASSSARVSLIVKGGWNHQWSVRLFNSIALARLPARQPLLHRVHAARVRLCMAPVKRIVRSHRLVEG